MSSKNQTKTELDKLVSLLGGWPTHYTQSMKKHGMSLLAFCREKMIVDQVTFGLICRYAYHRACFELLTKSAMPAAAAKRSKNEYMTGAEQKLAYHEKRLGDIEQQLLGTPFSRAKAGETVQTNFFEKLVDPQIPDDAEEEIEEKVAVLTPFRPISKLGRG